MSRLLKIECIKNKKFGPIRFGQMIFRPKLLVGGAEEGPPTKAMLLWLCGYICFYHLWYVSSDLDHF